MKFQLIPNNGLGWDKVIPKCEPIPEQLAQLGSTPPLFEF
jgi:hypothetical protein